MSNKEFEIAISDKDSKEQITIPAEKDSLIPFVSRLLGQPQSIEREVYGTFIIDHAWLLHINELINQRIRQQNRAALVDFTASINFRGNLKRTLTSLEEFKHYSETKKIKSQSIKITWTYLIHFPNSNMPEKQEVSLYINSKAPSASSREDPIRRLVSISSKLGIISYKINHTERTWGDDIETLLKDEIDLILKPENYFGVIGHFLLLICFFAICISIIVVPDMMRTIVQEKQVDKIFYHYNDIVLIKSHNFKTVGSKLDLLLKAVNPSNGIDKVSVSYRLLMHIFGLVILFWCKHLITKNKPSFVLLTRESYLTYQNYIKKSKRNHWIIILSFMFSIISGILANFGYYYLTI